MLQLCQKLNPPIHLERLKAISIQSNRFCRRYKENSAFFSPSSTVENLKYDIKIDDQASSRAPNKNLDIDFGDTKEAYKSKTTVELIRALFVLRVSSNDFIVNNHGKLLEYGRTLLGERLFFYLMKKTFYGQFVAGEDDVKIKPSLNHLKSFGVKSILDYSAEGDLTEGEESKTSSAKSDSSKQPKTDDAPHDEKLLEQFKVQPEVDNRRFPVTARTYFYLNEAQCEKNMEIFLSCIDAVAGVTSHTGFAAIKLTALCRPKLLLQLSEIITRTRLFHLKTTGHDLLGSNYQPEPSNIALADELFKQIEPRKRELIKIFAWNGLIDMRKLCCEDFIVSSLTTGKSSNLFSSLTDEEWEMFDNLMRRVNVIAHRAREMDVRVMIDSEQTYLQPAISRITIELMKKYNREKAIIFNTYQCYLKDAYENVLIDLELAKRRKFYFASKLVRGAYMEQERLRAKESGYADPINDTYESTSEMYHKTLSHLMNEILKTGIDSKKILVMVASHNEDTIRYAVNQMKELGIKPEHKVICFGQLYGMSDHISFLLGQSGYSAYKYVPYGPINEVLPYLSRRATENHGILAKTYHERSLISREIFRRMFSGELFHKPQGNYVPI